MFKRSRYLTLCGAANVRHCHATINMPEAFQTFEKGYESMRFFSELRIFDGMFLKRTDFAKRLHEIFGKKPSIQMGSDERCSFFKRISYIFGKNTFFKKIP